MGKPIQKDLGADLRKIRQKRGFSLKEVAGRMGVSMPYLSDLERGNRRWSDDLKEIFHNAICKQTKKKRV